MAEPRQPPRDHHRRMRPNTRPKFVDSSVPLNQATREDLVAALEVLDRREAITYEEKLLQAEWEDTSDEEEEEETDAVDNTQQEHVTWDPLIRPHQLFGDQVNVHSVDDITADEFRMIVKFLGEYGREYLHPQMPNEELYEVYDNDDCFSVAIRRFFNATGKWATANTIKDILKSKDYSIVVSDGNDHDQTYRMSNAEYEEKEVRIKAAMIEKLEAERKVMEESIKAREQSKMTAKDKGKAKEPATEKTKQDPPTKKGTQAKTQSRALRSLSLGDAARLLVGGPSSRKKVQAKKGIN
ncbi:MAG: hypothetical protein M1814_003650 [Vezdaea aestivalis]|nr:MAG: hypothetical protein M1814_003650 [Vezdaea aestivalis]